MTSADKVTLVQIPYVPPEEYEFLAVVRRVSENAIFIFGIVVDGQQCLACFGGALSGLHSWDCTGLETHKEAIRTPVIPYNVLVTLRCRVRKQDAGRYEVRMLCDDREVFTWQGEASRLILEDFRAPAVKNVLFLATGSSLHVSKLQATPFNGQGRPVDIASGSADRQVASACYGKEALSGSRLMVVRR